MLITTTNNLEGYKIKDYEGIVFGEVMAGMNFLRDMGAGLRNFFGGRSKGYEKELLNARYEAIEEMKDRARELNADAIIGVKFEYEVLGEGGSMLMVTCSGTAVTLKN